MKKHLPYAAFFLIYIFILLLQMRHIGDGAAALWRVIVDEPYYCVSFATGMGPYLLYVMLLFSITMLLVFLIIYAAILSGIYKQERFHYLYLGLSKLRYLFLSLAILSGISTAICYVQYEQPEQADAWVEKRLSPPDAEGVGQHYFTETQGELTQYYYVDKQHFHHTMLWDKAWHVYALRANLNVHAAQPYGDFSWLRGGILSAFLFCCFALMGLYGHIFARASSAPRGIPSSGSSEV